MLVAELLYTERAHVRNLKVMENLFHHRMSNEPWIQQDLVKALFPNLTEVIKVHGEKLTTF